MINQVIDEDLLSRLKAGDKDAFGQVFTRWEDPIIRFIDGIIDSPHDAEDISQDTFATLWDKRDTIDTSKNISTFIFLIAKQKTWKFIREHKRRGEYQADSIMEEESDISPEELMHARELEALVDYAISKLPARTREICRMHYYEGLSNEQISERLNINSINIASHIYQARKKIRDMVMVMITLLTSQNFIQ